MPDSKVIQEIEDSSIDSLLEDVPKEERDIAEHFLHLSMQMAKVSSPQSELMAKITPENISEITQIQSKEMDLTFKEAHEEKILYVIALAFVVVTIFGVIVLLKDQPEMLKEILLPLITLIIGSVGGYGVGYGKGKRE